MYLNPEPGDEIIVSPITDMGDPIAVLMQMCVPVFADVDPVEKRSPFYSLYLRCHILKHHFTAFTCGIAF